MMYSDGGMNRSAAIVAIAMGSRTARPGRAAAPLKRRLNLEAAAAAIVTTTSATSRRMKLYRCAAASASTIDSDTAADSMTAQYHRSSAGSAARRSRSRIGQAEECRARQPADDQRTPEQEQRVHQNWK